MLKLEVLGSQGIHRIDTAARSILQKTGVVVPHQRMLKLFENAGAAVNYENERVRIPGKLIDECLRQAEKQFSIFGRDHNKVARFGQGYRNYNSIAGEAHWIDTNGKRRFASMDDVVSAAKLGDVLPKLTIVGAMSDPYELDCSYRCVEVAATQLRTTTKPITFWFYDAASAKFVVELFAAIAGSSEQLKQFPFAYPFLEPISPLRFDTRGIDILFETCKVPLPVPIGPMAQVGMSAPCTLAGTIAQETAEILAGICVVQLIAPGTPVCFGGISHAFDMKTTQMIFAGPEQGLMATALTEMGKHYGLPVYINVGLTDSKVPDAQAGIEITATLMAGALAGADIFGHLGIAGVDQAASLEMLLLQHEIIGYIERFMESFDLSDDKIALDVIDKVGPGGNFIDQMHTVENFRKEIWMPGLLDRNYWSAWEESGRPDLASKLKPKLTEYMESYKEVPLADSVNKDVNNVLTDARKFLGKVKV